MRFQHKMSLNGREAGMLGIDHQHGAEKAHEPGADPGVHGSQRGDSIWVRNRKEIYNWVRETVVEKQYHVQGKAEKGLLRCYVAKVTGLSRAQVTRLIGEI